MGGSGSSRIPVISTIAFRYEAARMLPTSCSAVRPSSSLEARAEQLAELLAGVVGEHEQDSAALILDRGVDERRAAHRRPDLVDRLGETVSRASE